MKDEQDFNAACADRMEWLREILAAFQEKLSISADIDVLKQQVEDYEVRKIEINQKLLFTNIIFYFKNYNARRIGQANWPLKGFGQSKKQKKFI